MFSITSQKKFQALLVSILFLIIFRDYEAVKNCYCCPFIAPF